MGVIVVYDKSRDDEVFSFVGPMEQLLAILAGFELEQDEDGDWEGEHFYAEVLPF